MNRLIAIAFALLTVVFFILMTQSDTFFDWAFTRHQNQLSWYIRPLFIIPFCYFAFKKNWAGISITIFALFTSMFWFPKPEIISEQVITFLQFEKDWLNSAWNAEKILLTLTAPISFFILGLAFWKRSLLIAMGVIVLMATGKIIWSIHYAGESGKSIIIPAIVGLLICVILIYWGFKKLNKQKK